MALIVEYHVVADMYPVGSTAISAGMLVAMNPSSDSGEIIPATTALKDSVIGIAGDSALASAAQTTAYSDTVVVGATPTPTTTAKTRWTSNRVSDFYNETTASGKITVYNGGGKFWVSEDLVTSISTIKPGDGLKADDGGMFEEVANNADGDQAAICVGLPRLYPTGVPGTDTTDGSIALGNSANSGTTNLWMPIALRV